MHHWASFKNVNKANLLCGMHTGVCVCVCTHIRVYGEAKRLGWVASA